MIIIQIAGRLGKDAETRFTPSGLKVTTLTVATNVRKSGKEETVWWRVTVWGERFDKMMPYLKKGSAVIVVGEMGKPEIWTDKEGRPQVSLELTAEIIRFSPFSSERSGQDQPSSSQGQQTQNSHGGEQRQDAGSLGYKGFAETGAHGIHSGQATTANYSQFSENEDSLPF